MSLASSMAAPVEAPKLPAIPGPLSNILAFARRELRDALSSRWFLLYTVSFAVLAAATSFLSLSGAGSAGFAGLGRTAAGLLNLVMLVVPLMAISAGAGSIAGERERGTLLYLLAQPISPSELLLGKFVGLSLAICASLCLGFGLSALVLAWRSGGTGADSYLILVALTCVLAVVMVAVGLLVSTVSRKSGVAAGLGLFVWLGLALLSDIGLMAGSLVFKLRVEELFALAVANPLQAFKMAVIGELNSSLDVLGPAGMYAMHTFGSALPWLLMSVLVFWGVASLGLAMFIFSRKSAA